MSSFRVLARAPSNIAIVKYMGKVDTAKNLPANPSLSLTLSQLCTYVEIRESKTPGARLLPGRPEGAKGEAPKLTTEGEAKFLRHFARIAERSLALLREAGLGARAVAGVEIQSSNTFPAAAGIASSASSFAALTLAGVATHAKDPQAFRAKYAESTELRQALASLSREGSGSSCRSFEGPFVAWEREEARRIESHLAPLSDLVVVVSAGAKAVGSSEAHRRVTTSPHWDGRTTRAMNRYRDLKIALTRGDFSALSEIADADSRDMHRLFETSVPPFSYRASGTTEVLEFLAGETGIAVTMDAGPNVHVIVPQSIEEYWRLKLVARFPQYPVLVDREGTGAEFALLGSAE